MLCVSGVAWFSLAQEHRSPPDQAARSSPTIPPSHLPETAPPVGGQWHALEFPPRSVRAISSENLQECPFHCFVHVRVDARGMSRVVHIFNLDLFSVVRCHLSHTGFSGRSKLAVSGNTASQHFNSPSRILPTAKNLQLRRAIRATPAVHARDTRFLGPPYSPAAALRRCLCRALHERPHFNGARAHRGNPCCDGDGFIEIFGLDEVVAAELLARLGERAVGH